MISLAPATWAALEKVASEEDVTVGHVIREAIHRELFRRTRARKAEKPDERLIAPLRAILADDFAYSETWSELFQRVRSKGYDLIESGPGLVLATYPGRERLCKASELGYSHSRLARRLGTAFPAHAHAHVVNRMARL